MSDMPRILISFSSKTHGTAEIATWIADTLRSRNCEVMLQEAGKTPDLPEHDVAIIGSALYSGRWQRHPVRLLRQMVKIAAPQAVWLFHSGPLGDENAHQPMPLPKNVRVLADQLQLQDVATFGGRLPEKAPGLLRLLIRRASKPGDWRDPQQVTAWAHKIADTVTSSTPHTNGQQAS